MSRFLSGLLGCALSGVGLLLLADDARPGLLRSAGRIAWRFARALAAVLLVGLCLLWGSPAYAVETPAPYPVTGGAPMSWSCEDRASADAPPLTGADCIVTEWGINPEVVAPVLTGPGAALTDEQWQVLSFALGLLVFLAGVHTVGSWR